MSFVRWHLACGQHLSVRLITGYNNGGLSFMILILESHPVQYRAPVYRCLQRLRPDKFNVVYATDCSVRGHIDNGFGLKVKWDEPLLSGYPNLVLNNERGTPLSHARSLHGKGIFTAKLAPEGIDIWNLAHSPHSAKGIEPLRTQTQGKDDLTGRVN